MSDNDNKLVKEIITTTTERFHENGSIKEKITESREKVYDYGYSERQIAEAKQIVIEEKPKEIVREEEEKIPEDLISAAAAKINSNPENLEIQNQQVSPQTQPLYQPYQPSPIPQYNVVNRNPQPQQNTPNPPTFPWEKK